MIVLRDSSPVPAGMTGCVIALGNFDGLHLGHRAVIGKAKELARAAGKPLAVMTFEPHPRHVFKPTLPRLRILPLREKIRLLGEIGVDYLRIARFTLPFAQTKAQDFVMRYLHDRLHASHIVTGSDFIFGRNREGDFELLHRIARELGMEATACDQLDVDGVRCSSTLIRNALVAGKMEEAAKFLGRPYSLAGQVREGDRRGRTLGFPTANLLPTPTFMPVLGVYAVCAHVQGKRVNGVANLGMRPTFGGTRVRLEVHLFDWHQDIYGEHIEVELLHFIRGERKFDGIEALKKQITEDSETAKTLLADLT